ncbi:PHD finger protein ALFIN-LIKE 7 [Hondaea fermentalgiana]|uniref:PHD finger protein ALFIN-LIKE 7 n=1 Tax=Hondaea fermentalgiana TaxID=2315210 RepID=A0A2R5GPV2_9STRA|nr:PHD finger protein ALFIN-LIKE 7 [Hondaea fermentalgiana]|eukprot:GBG29914.1 PHD finger protein ALFIN-LIKE 7 [Hondaea fermentalgiana]
MAAPENAEVNIAHAQNEESKSKDVATSSKSGATSINAVMNEAHEQKHDDPHEVVPPKVDKAVRGDTSLPKASVPAAKEDFIDAIAHVKVVVRACLAKAEASTSNPAAEEETALRKELDRFCDALVEADKFCKAEQLIDNVVSAAADEIGEERSRRVRFATSTLLPLTTPNIGIEGSEDPWFGALESLAKARDVAESLRKGFRAKPALADALRGALPAPAGNAASAIRTELAKSASENAGEVSTVKADDANSKFSQASPSSSSTTGVPGPDAEGGTTAAPQAKSSTDPSPSSSSFTSPDLPPSASGASSRYRTPAEQVVRKAILEIANDKPCAAVEEPLGEILSSSIRFILRKLFNVPPTCELALEDVEPVVSSPSGGGEEIRLGSSGVALEDLAASGGNGAETDGELEALASTMSSGLPRPRATQLIFGADCGSYQFNSDDAAAVLRDALGILRHCVEPTEAWRRWYTAGQHAPEDAPPDLDLTHVRLFTRAHSFLDSTFAKDREMRVALEKETELLARLEKCCARADELGLEEEVAFYPLTKPGQFVEQIAAQRELSKTASEWLDAHEAALNPRSYRSRPRRCRVVIEPGHVDGGDFRFPVLHRRLAASVCAMCETLVEESNRGGEICCDTCGRWFHLKCLQLPQRFPQTVEFYTCPDCVPGQSGML